jgi:hypothetical protein
MHPDKRRSPAVTRKESWSAAGRVVSTPDVEVLVRGDAHPCIPQPQPGLAQRQQCARVRDDALQVGLRQPFQAGRSRLADLAHAAPDRVPVHRRAGAARAELRRTDQGMGCSPLEVDVDPSVHLVGHVRQCPAEGALPVGLAPPFTDFLRVVRDDGPAEYVYFWMIDPMPQDLQGFLERAVSRPLEEICLFSFSFPQFAPIFESSERDGVQHLSTRSSIQAALKEQAPDITIAIPFDGATEISELLSRYVKWHAAGRLR